MSVTLIKEQTHWVDHWTTNLITDLDDADFGVVTQLGTSINWQIGHIIISKYFHTLQSIVGTNDEVLKALHHSIPIDDFFNYYFAGSDPLVNWTNRPNKQQLLHYKKEVDLAVDTVLEQLTENQLSQNTEVGNPVAQSKYDALLFSFKHQMWHNGQIAMLKRILHS